MSDSRKHTRPDRRKSTLAVILAGGLSTRMGRDKAALRLGRRTLLAHVRVAAKAAGLPVRVVRRDEVPRCGPLGGVLTAFRQTTADRLIFLSCDQPFVSETAIRRLARGRAGVFFEASDGVVGFPFSLGRIHQALVERQIARGEFSLQRLATVIDARRWRIPRREAWRWFNVNTPADFDRAREVQRQRLAARRLNSTQSA